MHIHSVLHYCFRLFNYRFWVPLSPMQRHPSLWVWSIVKGSSRTNWYALLGWSALSSSSVCTQIKHYYYNNITINSNSFAYSQYEFQLSVLKINCLYYKYQFFVIQILCSGFYQDPQNGIVSGVSTATSQDLLQVIGQSFHNLPYTSNIQKSKCFQSTNLFWNFKS